MLERMLSWYASQKSQKMFIRSWFHQLEDRRPNHDNDDKGDAEARLMQWYYTNIQLTFFILFSS